MPRKILLAISIILLLCFSCVIEVMVLSSPPPPPKKSIINKTFKIVSEGPANGTTITVLSTRKLENNKTRLITYKINSSLLVFKGFFKNNILSLKINESQLFLNGKINSSLLIGYELNGTTLSHANLILLTKSLSKKKENN